MATVFVHIRTTDNVGDLNCCPAAYFPFPDVVVADMRGRIPLTGGDTLVFGGGGLLQQRRRPQIQHLLSLPCASRIAWGIGHLEDGKGPDYSAWPELAAFDLIGVRDSDAGYPWVPCASCMSRLFDAPRGPEHDVVAYSSSQLPMRVPQGVPHEDNRGSFAASVAFLASGRTVVTSSYHGAYWAMLLGRKVLVAKACGKTKMHGFPVPPAF
ncbi:MAG TPA: hypothetical protein VMW52_08275 [Phycisphaerae bacterium]|nr:hypothetical protein [Phycisphaerae bacterium]